MQQRGMDHNGTSTAEPQKKNSKNSQPPLAWLPLSNVHLKEEPTQALQLKPGKKDKTPYLKSNSPRDTSYADAA